MNVESLQQEEQQLVVFDLATEGYGIDIGAVREIIRVQDITKVPGVPNFVEGVINLRSKVIPVVNLRKRFALPVADESQDNRIVVVDIGSQDIGVVVDAVTEVLRIAPDSFEPPTPVITGNDSDYLLGLAKLDGRMIILVDLERVLSKSEQQSLTGLPSVTSQSPGKPAPSQVAEAPKAGGGLNVDLLEQSFAAAAIRG